MISTCKIKEGIWEYFEVELEMKFKLKFKTRRWNLGTNTIRTTTIGYNNFCPYCFIEETATREASNTAFLAESSIIQ